MIPTIRRNVRLPKVMKNLFIFSRCDGNAIYGVYGAWNVRGSAQIRIHHNGFFILSKIFLKFNFFEISKLYYNIMSRLYIFLLKKGIVLL